MKEDEIDTDPAESDSVPRINTTSLSHQNCKVLEWTRVKGQPQVEHLVPPQPSASTIIPEDGKSISEASCSDVVIQESVTAKNISSATAMETSHDITLANKGMPSGATQPSTEEMDDKISHQPDMASAKVDKIIEEIKRNESFILP